MEKNKNGKIEMKDRFNNFLSDLIDSQKSLRDHYKGLKNSLELIILGKSKENKKHKVSLTERDIKTFIEMLESKIKVLDELIEENEKR